MAIGTPELEGPSEHAVKLARFWLLIGGWVWLFVGIALLLSVAASELWGPLAIVAFGLAHFIAARFASRRVAVFFAFFSP